MLMTKPTYIGKLVGVVVSGRKLWTEPRVMGVVPDRGIVTASSRAALARRDFDRRAPSRAQVYRLDSVLYDRRRQGYSDRKWQHKTPDARVALWRAGGRVSVLILAPRERRCDWVPGDFLCSI